MSTAEQVVPAGSLVVVVGAGPGVGGAVARRWAADGHPVALVSLVPAELEELAATLSGEGVQVAGWRAADLADPVATSRAIAELVGTATVGVLHFNPSAFRQKDPLTLTPAELAEDVALGVGALLTCVQAVRPHLVAGSRVTVTGSMAADRPWHEAASLGVQKAGVRNLVHSLDRTLAPDGIRAVSVTVEGTLAHDDPDSPFHPTRVAAALHDAALQSEESWQAEVRHPG